MEITKREILASIAIVALMLFFGFLISGKINDSLMDWYQEYDTALRVDNDATLFRYGMRTNVGRAFVYGEVKAVDPVTYPEIGGSYSHVDKVKEKYTQHTRIITYTDSEGHAHTRVETYWTWDEVGRETIHSQLITFLGIEFKYGKIPFTADSYITTVKESSHIRYKYYATGTSCKGTAYTLLGDGTITDTDFHRNCSIDETVNNLESGWELILFWVLWILLIAGLVFGFYYIDNKWLED